MNIDDMFDAYVECALWSSADDNGRPLDDNFDASDIAPESLEEMGEVVEGMSEPTDMTADDGSLLWASLDWMRARGIESVDAHGRFVYAEGYESDAPIVSGVGEE